MKLTTRMALTFTAALVAVLALGLTLTLLQSSGRMTSNIVEKTLVLVRTFESQLYTGSGKESSDGKNEIFTRAVGHIAKAMPTVLEINVYRVDIAKVVASNDEAMVGKAVDPEDLQAAREDKGVVLFATEEGKPVIDVTEPLHEDGKVEYVVGIKNDVSRDFADLNGLILWSVLLGVAGALGGCAVIVFAARKLTQPLRQTGKLFRAMAAGDLTGRSGAKGKDELADLARDYNAFTDQLEGEIRRLQEVSINSRRLGHSLAESSRTVDQGIGVIRNVLQDLQGLLTTLNQGVNSPDFTLGDVREFLKTLLADLENQSVSVDKSRTTTHEMVEALRLISSETNEKLSLAEGLTAQGRDGDAQMQATVQTIRQLTKLTEGIAGFIQVIHDIADQTNLLAMNASIEAAHAGNSGRGFAVVAGEIRKLSEATSTNAKSIASSLEVMVEAVRKAEADVSGTGKAIHKLTTGVESLATAMTTVRSTLQNLADETDTVTLAFDHLRSLTDGVLDRSATMGTRLGKLEGVMAGLVDVANKNAQGFDEITTRLDGLAEGSSRLLGMVEENETNAETLEEVTGKFRTTQG